MGNIVTETRSGILATSALAKHMTLSQEQVLVMRGSSLTMCSSKKGTIKRKHFDFAMQKAQVAEKDQVILMLLFTMWDETGKDKVPCLDFLVGLSPLACKTESTLNDVLRFGMVVLDYRRTEKINSLGAITVLKSINATASYFGDQMLTMRHIYKIVDSVFENLSFVDQNCDDALAHDDCLELLSMQPILLKVIQEQKLKPRDTVVNSLRLTPLGHVRVSSSFRRNDVVEVEVMR